MPANPDVLSFLRRGAGLPLAAALLALLAACSSTPPGLANPGADSVAYRDAAVLADTPAPPAPWVRDLKAPGFAYRSYGGSRVHQVWTAPKKTPSPLEALAEAAKAKGWEEFRRDTTSMQWRRDGETLDARLSKDGRQLVLERFSH